MGSAAVSELPESSALILDGFCRSNQTADKTTGNPRKTNSNRLVLQHFGRKTKDELGSLGAIRKRMDISTGFQIEQPKVFIPWGCSPSELRRLFVGHSLEEVFPDMFSTSCTSLGGLSHLLRFDFQRQLWGLFRPRLNELHFSHHPCSQTGVVASFEAFPKHLRATFGEPSATSLDDSDGDLQSDTWTLPSVVISYVVFQNQGGPEELLKFTKL